MFTIQYRPDTFQDVVGQAIPKKVLNAILSNPEVAPKTYLLHGPWGTGKSCLAQIFGKAINCSSLKKPCNRCDNCKNLRLYQELDSAMTGNAKVIRDLRESWYFSVEKGWRVVVVDEIQVASPPAQSALLKVLEDPPKNCFFLLLTTNPEKVVKPVISRSLELTFNLLTDKEVEEVVNRTLRRESREISEEVMGVIVRRAGGHARDSVMLLEMALIVGEEEFLKAVVLSDRLYRRVVGNFLMGNKEAAGQAIKELMKSPVAYLKVDFERFVLLLFSKVVGEGVTLFKGALDESKLMKLLNYYVRIKPLLGSSSSDFASVLYGLGPILIPAEKEKSNDIRPIFQKVR